MARGSPAAGAPRRRAGANTVRTPGRSPAIAVGIEDAHERRRQGQEDPGAVARGAVGGEGAAMTEGAEAAERQGEHPGAGPAAGVRDEPDPAGVVLVARVVEGRLGALAVPGLSLWGAVFGHLRLPIGRRTNRRPMTGGCGPASAPGRWGQAW